MQHIDNKSLGIVLSGGGMYSAYATGALCALMGTRGLRPQVIVALSGGAAPAAFALAGRYENMYSWAQLFDDPRFISWTRLRNGPIMDTTFLVESILRVQAPSLESELAKVPTKLFLAATRFPEGTTQWLHDQPLFEQLRATKTMPGVSSEGVWIEGIHYADGCLSTTIEDGVSKAFKEGAERVIVVDNGSNQISSFSKSLLHFGSRRFAPYVRTALGRFCERTIVPFFLEPDVLVCKPKKLPTRHQLDRDKKRSAASIKIGYADAMRLQLFGRLS